MVDDMPSCSPDSGMVCRAAPCPALFPAQKLLIETDVRIRYRPAVIPSMRETEACFRIQNYVVDPYLGMSIAYTTLIACYLTVKEAGRCRIRWGVIPECLDMIRRLLSSSEIDEFLS